MKEFNYKRAWNELAKPAYDKLGVQALAFVALVTETYQEIHQAPDLGMPETVEVLETVQAMSSADLTSVAQAIYYCGHWGYREEKAALEEEAPPSVGVLLQSAGIYWKVSKLADQELARRVFVGTIERNRVEDSPGLELWIDAGKLNIAISHQWSFGDVFGVGTPTKELIAEVRAVLKKRSDFGYGRRKSDEWGDEMRAAIEAVKAKHVGECFDTESYMEEK